MERALNLCDIVEICKEEITNFQNVVRINVYIIALE